MLEQYKPALKQGVTMTIIGLLIFFITYAIDPLFLAKPKRLDGFNSCQYACTAYLFFNNGSQGL